MTNSPSDDKSSHPEIEKLTKDVSQLKDHLLSMTKSLFNLTDDTIMSGYRATRENARSWIDSQAHSAGSDTSSFEIFPAPYETRALLTSPFGILDDLANLSLGVGLSVFGSDFHGRTPFGMYSRNAPSTRDYNDCIDKEGLSIWESTGYWRCLFPDHEVPADLLQYKNKHLSDKILTRQDYDKALVDANKSDYAGGAIDLGPKGIFFLQFEDLLKWKKEKYEAASKALDTKSSVSDLAKENPNQRVVATEVHSNVVTNPDTNRVEMEEIRTLRFSDGTSVTEKARKYKPFDSDTWVDISKESDDDKSPGWFWKNE